MTGEELAARTATFDTRADAQRAADATMPRRKHNRPYAQSSGYHWAQAGRPAHDVYIVCAPSNLVLLDDGSYFDASKVTVRQ
jgi:hypothetical protein